MSIERSTAQGCALFFAAFGVLAMGCVARDNAGSENATPAEPAAPVEHAAEAARWHGNDCPAETHLTAEARPPHALLGPCESRAHTDQAIRDGAEEELEFLCQSYCGETNPSCAARARLLDIACVDREAGHAWKAICGCDS